MWLLCGVFSVVVGGLVCGWGGVFVVGGGLFGCVVL